MSFDVIYVVLCALLWGGTNPFIKRGTAGIEKIQCDGPVRQFFAELRFLLVRPQYLVPQVLNLCGSVAFFMALRTLDLTIASVAANSLTFAFTFLVGRLLGEKENSMASMCGMLCVVAGVCICVASKSLQ